MSSTMPPMIYIELTVVAMITVAVFLTALTVLRDRHYGDRKWAARFGAIIYGLLFGTFTGFVLVPIYMLIMNGQASYADPEIMKRRFPAFIVLMVLFRTDILGRLPIVGTYVRAYRMANMRRSVENATKRLEKMEALELSARGE